MSQETQFPVCWQWLRPFRNVKLKVELKLCGISIILEQIKDVSEGTENWRQTMRFFFTLCISVCCRVMQLVAIFHYDGLCIFCVGCVTGITSLLFKLSLFSYFVELVGGGMVGGGCCGESLHAVEHCLSHSDWPWLIASSSLCFFPL